MISKQLMEDRRLIADFVNKFVEENGYDKVFKNDRLMELFRENGVYPKDVMYLNSDICYDSANDGITNEFMDTIHLFTRPKHGYYRLLGENYPYTGPINHKPKGSKDIYVVGEWLNGKIISWKPGEREKIEDFENKILAEFDDIEKEFADVLGEDKVVLTKARVNQSSFRNRLLKRYMGQCCLCGMSEAELLLASHIKPWAVATAEEKVDVNNGLLLCPHHDKAFDRGFISFDDTGRIIISSMLSMRDALLLNLNKEMNLTVASGMRGYLEYHRNNIYRHSNVGLSEKS